MPGSDVVVSPRPKEQLPERPSTAVPVIDVNEHEFRQRVSNAYQQICSIKPSLKNWLKIHLGLGMLLVIKLIPFLLDKADIFILLIEELEIPKPLLWEWIWLSSCLTCFVAFTAIKKNKSESLRLFIWSEIGLGLTQVVWCFAIYFADATTFFFSEDKYERDSIAYWKGYPISILNYIFLVVALQTHGFCIYYANELSILWSINKGRKTQ